MTTLAACSGSGSSGVGAENSSSPAATATSAAPSATPSVIFSTHPSVRKITPPTHAASTQPPAPVTPRPTVARTTARPKPTSTAPTACPTNTSSASLAMVNSGTDYAFSPTSLTVSCGGTVHITNNSTAPHNMSPTDGGFAASGDVNPPNGTANVRFSYRGTYGFYCSIHSYMTGTVKVS